MLTRKKAARTAIVVTGIFGISFSVDLGVASVSTGAKANPVSEAHLAEAAVETEVLPDQEFGDFLEHRAEPITERLLVEEQEVEEQDEVQQPVDEQGIAEQTEAAIAEVMEAIASDSAHTHNAADRSDNLLDQLLASALDGNMSENNRPSHPPVPTADALGEPISVGVAASSGVAASPEPLSSIDLATVEANISSASSVAPDRSAPDLPALRTALTSENELTRLYAADTLWTLTSDADLILPTLVSAANSGNTETRELALAAIAQLGQAAIPAIPVLNDIAANSDSRTRLIAQDVLEVVSSENRPATVLGILAREVQRIGGIPALFRAISRLW